MNPNTPDLPRYERLDQSDELASFKERFVKHDPELIYLLGNSLGRLPKSTVERLDHLVVEEWGGDLIRGWNHGWIEMPARIGDKIGRLLGARQGEVLMADSTSVNLYKLALAALRLRPGRSKIVTDAQNFPSDLYILEGAVRSGREPRHLQIVSSPDQTYGAVDELAEAIDEDTALVSLSHTIFRSAYIYDMAQLTEIAHDAGALVLWDLSHSVGSVPVDLTGAGADFAVGCTYKYLSGGPGAPAFLYVRRELQEEAGNPVPGWMGQNRPFDLDLEYQAAPGLRRFLTGTPPILSLAAVEEGVDLILEAGMERLRAKSIRQTEYLIELWEQHLQPLGFELRSPRESERRGAHVAFGHPEALRISRALKEKMHVIPDFRHPDNIRFAVGPLYTSFTDLHEAVKRTCTVITERLYEAFPKEAPMVT